MAAKSKVISLSAFRYEEEPHMIVQVRIADKATSREVGQHLNQEITKLLCDKGYDDDGRGSRYLVPGEMLLLNGPMSIGMAGTIAAAFALRGFGVAILNKRASDERKTIDIYEVNACPSAEYALGEPIRVKRRP